MINLKKKKKKLYEVTRGIEARLLEHTWLLQFSSMGTLNGCIGWHRLVNCGAWVELCEGLPIINCSGKRGSISLSQNI